MGASEKENQPPAGKQATKPGGERTAVIATVTFKSPKVEFHPIIAGSMAPAVRMRMYDLKDRNEHTDHILRSGDFEKNAQQYRVLFGQAIDSELKFKKHDVATRIIQKIIAYLNKGASTVNTIENVDLGITLVRKQNSGIVTIRIPGQDNKNLAARFEFSSQGTGTVSVRQTPPPDDDKYRDIDSWTETHPREELTTNTNPVFKRLSNALQRRKSHFVRGKAQEVMEAATAMLKQVSEYQASTPQVAGNEPDVPCGWSFSGDELWELLDCDSDPTRIDQYFDALSKHVNTITDEAEQRAFWQALLLYTPPDASTTAGQPLLFYLTFAESSVVLPLLKCLQHSSDATVAKIICHIVTPEEYDGSGFIPGLKNHAHTVKLYCDSTQFTPPPVTRAIGMSYLMHVFDASPRLVEQGLVETVVGLLERLNERPEHKISVQRALTTYCGMFSALTFAEFIKSSFCQRLEALVGSSSTAVASARKEVQEADKRLAALTTPKKTPQQRTGLTDLPPLSAAKRRLALALEASITPRTKDGNHFLTEKAAVGTRCEALFLSLIAVLDDQDDQSWRRVFREVMASLDFERSDEDIDLPQPYDFLKYEHPNHGNLLFAIFNARRPGTAVRRMDCVLEIIGYLKVATPLQAMAVLRPVIRHRLSLSVEELRVFHDAVKAIVDGWLGDEAAENALRLHVDDQLIVIGYLEWAAGLISTPSDADAKPPQTPTRGGGAKPGFYSEGKNEVNGSVAIVDRLLEALEQPEPEEKGLLSLVASPLRKPQASPREEIISALEAVFKLQNVDLAIGQVLARADVAQIQRLLAATLEHDAVPSQTDDKFEEITAGMTLSLLRHLLPHCQNDRTASDKLDSVFADTRLSSSIVGRLVDTQSSDASSTSDCLAALIEQPGRVVSLLKHLAAYHAGSGQQGWFSGLSGSTTDPIDRTLPLLQRLLELAEADDGKALLASVLGDDQLCQTLVIRLIAQTAEANACLQAMSRYPEWVKLLLSQARAHCATHLLSLLTQLVSLVDADNIRSSFATAFSDSELCQVLIAALIVETAEAKACLQVMAQHPALVKLLLSQTHTHYADQLLALLRLLIDACAATNTVFTDDVLEDVPLRRAIASRLIAAVENIGGEEDACLATLARQPKLAQQLLTRIYEADRQQAFTLTQCLITASKTDDCAIACMLGNSAFSQVFISNLASGEVDTEGCLQAVGARQKLVIALLRRARENISKDTPAKEALLILQRLLVDFLQCTFAAILVDNDLWTWVVGILLKDIAEATEEEKAVVAGISQRPKLLKVLFRRMQPDKTRPLLTSLLAFYAAEKTSHQLAEVLNDGALLPHVIAAVVANSDVQSTEGLPLSAGCLQAPSFIVDLLKAAKAKHKLQDALPVLQALFADYVQPQVQAAVAAVVANDALFKAIVAALVQGNEKARACLRVALTQPALIQQILTRMAPCGCDRELALFQALVVAHSIDDRSAVETVLEHASFLNAVVRELATGDEGTDSCLQALIARPALLVKFLEKACQQRSPDERPADDALKVLVKLLETVEQIANVYPVILDNSVVLAWVVGILLKDATVAIEAEKAVVAGISQRPTLLKVLFRRMQPDETRPLLTSLLAFYAAEKTSHQLAEVLNDGALLPHVIDAVFANSEDQSVDEERYLSAGCLQVNDFIVDLLMAAQEQDKLKDALPVLQALFAGYPRKNAAVDMIVENPELLDAIVALLIEDSEQPKACLRVVLTQPALVALLFNHCKPHRQLPLLRQLVVYCDVSPVEAAFAEVFNNTYICSDLVLRLVDNNDQATGTCLSKVLTRPALVKGLFVETMLGDEAKLLPRITRSIACTSHLDDGSMGIVALLKDQQLSLVIVRQVARGGGAASDFLRALATRPSCLIAFLGETLKRPTTAEQSRLVLQAFLALECEVAGYQAVFADLALAAGVITKLAEVDNPQATYPQVFENPALLGLVVNHLLSDEQQAGACLTRVMAHPQLLMSILRKLQQQQLPPLLEKLLAGVDSDRLKRFQQLVEAGEDIAIGALAQIFKDDARGKQFISDLSSSDRLEAGSCLQAIVAYPSLVKDLLTQANEAAGGYRALSLFYRLAEKAEQIGTTFAAVFEDATLVAALVSELIEDINPAAPPAIFEDATWPPLMVNHLLGSSDLASGCLAKLIAKPRLLKWILSKLLDTYSPLLPRLMAAVLTHTATQTQISSAITELLDDTRMAPMVATAFVQHIGQFFQEGSDSALSSVCTDPELVRCTIAKCCGQQEHQPALELLTCVLTSFDWEIFAEEEDFDDDSSPPTAHGLLGVFLDDPDSTKLFVALIAARLDERSTQDFLALALGKPEFLRRLLVNALHGRNADPKSALLVMRHLLTRNLSAEQPNHLAFLADKTLLTALTLDTEETANDCLTAIFHQPALVELLLSEMILGHEEGTGESRAELTNYGLLLIQRLVERYYWQSDSDEDANIEFALSKVLANHDLLGALTTALAADNQAAIDCFTQMIQEPNLVCALLREMVNSEVLSSRALLFLALLFHYEEQVILYALKEVFADRVVLTNLNDYFQGKIDGNSLQPVQSAYCEWFCNAAKEELGAAQSPPSAVPGDASDGDETDDAAEGDTRRGLLARGVSSISGFFARHDNEPSAEPTPDDDTLRVLWSALEATPFNQTAFHNLDAAGVSKLLQRAHQTEPQRLWQALLGDAANAQWLAGFKSFVELVTKDITQSQALVAAVLADETGRTILLANLITHLGEFLAVPFFQSFLGELYKSNLSDDSLQALIGQFTDYKALLQRACLNEQVLASNPLSRRPVDRLYPNFLIKVIKLAGNDVEHERHMAMVRRAVYGRADDSTDVFCGTPKKSGDKKNHCFSPGLQALAEPLAERNLRMQIVNNERAAFLALVKQTDDEFSADWTDDDIAAQAKLLGLECEQNPDGVLTLIRLHCQSPRKREWIERLLKRLGETDDVAAMKGLLTSLRNNPELPQVYRDLSRHAQTCLQACDGSSTPPENSIILGLQQSIRDVQTFVSASKNYAVTLTREMTDPVFPTEGASIDVAALKGACELILRECPSVADEAQVGDEQASILEALGGDAKPVCLAARQAQLVGNLKQRLGTLVTTVEGVHRYDGCIEALSASPFDNVSAALDELIGATTHQAKQQAYAKFNAALRQIPSCSPAFSQNSLLEWLVLILETLLVLPKVVYEAAANYQAGLGFSTVGYGGMFAKTGQRAQALEQLRAIATESADLAKSSDHVIGTLDSVVDDDGLDTQPGCICG